ncbi:MAG: DUF4234 domain-containing protein [Ruminococcus sp.]|nr:DUF4234 domain-containing protein [Ruminococcus sp.]
MIILTVWVIILIIHLFYSFTIHINHKKCNFYHYTILYSAPVGQLSTSRDLLKVILLSLITFGIYGIIFYSGLSKDVNAIASRYDGRKTMHYCLMCFVVAPLTLGIGLLVWCHNISDRIGNELKRRGIDYSFNAGTFWLWYVLGAIVIVGPFVYLHKMCVAMNKLSENYNIHG